MKYEQVMVRVGGGKQKLLDFLVKVHKQHKVTLGQHLARTGQPLKHIVDCLARGVKVKPIQPGDLEK